MSIRRRFFWSIFVAGILWLVGKIVDFIYLVALTYSPQEAATRTSPWISLVKPWIFRRSVAYMIFGLIILAILVIWLSEPIAKAIRRKTPIEKLWKQYGKYGFSWVAWGEGPAADKDKWKDKNIYEIPLVETVKYLLMENEWQLPAKVNYSTLRMPPDFLHDIPKRLRIEYPNGSTVAFDEGAILRFDREMEVSRGIVSAQRQFPSPSQEVLSVDATPIRPDHHQNLSEPPWPFAEMPTQWVGKMKGKFTSFANGIYELRKDDQIFTDNYPTPVAFELIAKTDKYELRFGYIEKEMIFNWGSNFDEFRVGSGPAADKGPFDGRHVPNQGRIPENAWVKIVVIATLDSLEIWADGTQRFFGKADLSRFNEPFRVSQWGLSVIQVKSLLVGLPIGTESQTKYLPRPQFDPKNIVYAEYGSTEKGFHYWADTHKSGEMLADYLRELFKRPSPDQLTNGLLGIHDPEFGPHKILRFKLSDGRCFFLNEYARITIDSAMPMAPFQPFIRNGASSGST